MRQSRAWNEIQPVWQVLVLPVARFQDPPPLPASFSFTDVVDREVERRLLEDEFDHWQVPFERRFRGARADSLGALKDDDRVAMVGYLAEDNQLGLGGYGELLYVASDPAYRGRGLYKSLAWRLFARGREWGLNGVVLVPNRSGLDQVYARWGAIRIGNLRNVGPVRRRLALLRHPQAPLRRAAARALSQIE